MISASIALTLHRGGLWIFPLALSVFAKQKCIEGCGREYMIIGIGIDTVEIERFASWHTYSKQKLLRIFSRSEIDYCLEKSNQSAERFAVRFAAREALYKAVSYAFPNKRIPFLTLCASVSVTKKDGLPHFIIHDDLSIDTNSLTIHLSLSHSRTIATAFIVIEKK